MTVPGVHYLRLDDVLEAIARSTGLELGEIATDEVVERARHAIDAPGAERRSALPERELFPGLAEKAAVLCERLLVEPPYREVGGKVACECLDLFLFRNGARWVERRIHTSLRFEEVIRDPAAGGGIRQWIIERIEAPASRAAGANQPDLFTPASESPTVVFLSGPLKGLSLQHRESLTKLRAEVEEAVGDAAAEAGEACEIRLEHPSTQLPSTDEEHGGTGDESCREAWEYTSRLIAEQVDALVIVDIALQSAGFGATSEFDLHSLQDGPTLYVRRAGSSSSRFLRGRLAEADLELGEYEDLAEVGPIVVDWISRRWHTIRTAARRRRDRRVQYGQLRKQLDAAWRRATPETRELAADAAGMKLDAVNRVLTSTGLLSVLPAHRLDALCRSLGIGPRSQGVRRPDDDVMPDYSALLAAAEENGWPAATINRLFKDASRMDRPPAYATRPRYRQKSDWVKRCRDLGL